MRPGEVRSQFDKLKPKGSVLFKHRFLPVMRVWATGRLVEWNVGLGSGGPVYESLLHLGPRDEVVVLVIDDQEIQKEQSRL